MNLDDSTFQIHEGVGLSTRHDLSITSPQAPHHTNILINIHSPQDAIGSSDLCQS